MASVYSQAVTSSAGARRASTRALGMAKKNLLKTKEFELDEQINFDKLAKKASKKFGTLKTIGSLVGTAIAWGTGMGPLHAAITAAGATAAGGLAGQKAAGEVMKDQKWFNRTQADLQEGMTKQTLSSALVSGVMAGAGAKGGAAKGEVPGLAEAGAEGAVKTTKGVGEMQLVKGLEQSKITELGWKTGEGKELLAKQMAGSSDEAISTFGKANIDLPGNWGDKWKESFGVDWADEGVGQAAWDEAFLQKGTWGDKGAWVGPEIDIPVAAEKPTFGSEFEYKRNPIFGREGKGSLWKERPKMRSWDDIKTTWKEGAKADYSTGSIKGPINLFEDGIGKLNKPADMIGGDFTKQFGQNIYKAGSSFFNKDSGGLKSGLTLMQLLGQGQEEEPKYPWMRQ